MHPDNAVPEDKPYQRKQVEQCCHTSGCHDFEGQTVRVSYFALVTCPGNSQAVNGRSTTSRCLPLAANSNWHFFLSATTGQIGSVYERARDPASFRTQGRRRNLYSLFFFSARLAIAVSSAGTPSSCGTLAFHKFRIFVPALFFSCSLFFHVG